MRRLLIEFVVTLFVFALISVVPDVSKAQTDRQPGTSLPLVGIVTAPPAP